MNIVIEGTGEARRIISVGVDSVVYDLKPGQELRHIELWGGWRKADVHWNETQQKVIEAPYPLTPEETMAKQERDQNDQLLSTALLGRILVVLCREIVAARQSQPMTDAFKALVQKIQEIYKT